ncbi:uncharacterized protein LOC113767942 [Coffea eugenioides]|uniref:uncharacterized protein LOC113767942 n=1 Tax=Coffea eugenioides TaxID=49369 RepID=UPI000F6119DB|nr:uncharacterized protein LOC113767942 [Coffea eugenioides]
MSSSAPSKHGFRQVVVPIVDNRQFMGADQVAPRPTQESPCGRICAIVACIILVLLCPGLFGYTIELVNNFKDPRFQVESFSFSAPKLSTRSDNINDIPITANWSIGISITNPAKHHAVTFENIEVSVLYDATKILSTETIGTFREAPMDVTRFVVHPKAWLESSVASAIANDSRADGAVDFDLRVWANSTYIMKITHKRYHLVFDVHCRNLKVGFSSNATEGEMLLGGSKQCLIAGYLEMHTYN